MKIKRILVTGAAGYIGRHVVAEAINAGCEVFAADLTRKGVDERATFIDRPLFDTTENLYELFGSPDMLIHLAWRDGFVHNSPQHMACLSDHALFLNKMIDSGLPMLSVMGSMHEIGYWEGSIDADTPCNPLSQYGVAKNALRQSLSIYCKDKTTQFNWLRAYYIYGDDAYGSSIFAKLLQAARKGQSNFPFTSGKNRYDFISVELLAKQIVAASLQSTYSGVINVCTGVPERLSDKVEWYIKKQGLSIQLEYGKFPDRPYDSPGVWGDATIIQKIMETGSPLD